MADRRRQDSMDDGDDFVGSHDLARTVGSNADNPRSDGGGESSGSGSSNGLADRLSEILVDDGDGDLLLQHSDRENNYLQWLQALDFQVMGACRADERMKPLLKANASSGASEDRLLAYLSQHFEASEVGLLARCLCVPLVSMRVGKVVKQGTLLCPTSVRGNLNLTLLPSSDLRISFVGDDGLTQRLATLSDVSECSAVTIEEILADQSGRSFLLNVPGRETFYFWCAEKAKLLGNELLFKMKDLLKTKPTLPELTGISESRLECFASHLRSFFAGSSVNTPASASSAPKVGIRPDSAELGLNTHPFSTSVRPLRSRHNGGQALKGHTQYQGSLSPRSSSFKEGPLRTLSSLKIASREKLRRRGDLHLPTDSSFMTDAVLNLSENSKESEASGSSSVSPLSLLESLEKCDFQPCATSQFPPISSLFSPYYCWCPPCTTPTMAPISQLPSPLAEPFSLPSLSTLLPATGTPSLLTQLPAFDLSGGPPLNFPSLVTDPLARLPFSKQISQQIPIFTPLMCDPIVHIPVLDVCSSGQGYLVSTGSAIATNIPPLHPNLVGPMMSESESMMEKGARETLRLLISSSSGGQPSATFMNVLPAVLNEDKQGVIVAGSRGLYSGTSDVDAIVNSFAAVGLASLSQRSLNVSGLNSSASTSAADALGHTSGGVDFQDSTFLSRKEESDC